MISSFEQYKEDYKRSIEYPEKFWDEIANQFSAEPRTANTIQLVMHQMRNEVLEQLRQFPPDGKLFRTWLIKARQSYTRYLERLQSPGEN